MERARRVLAQRVQGVQGVQGVRGVQEGEEGKGRLGPSQQRQLQVQECEEQAAWELMTRQLHNLNCRR